MSKHPPKLAFDLDRDLRILTAMASSLTPYLYENEMYGYLEGDLPRLTLGGLLLRLYRLARLEDMFNPEQQDLVQNARLNFEAERSQWAVHYENKLQNELRSRVDALDQFITECAEDMRGCVESYPVQAEKRTMIEHLAAEAGQYDVLSDEMKARLKLLDQRLRRMVYDGGFVFNDQLIPAYPQAEFWWLYCHFGEELHPNPEP